MKDTNAIEKALQVKVNEECANIVDKFIDDVNFADGIIFWLAVPVDEIFSSWGIMGLEISFETALSSISTDDKIDWGFAIPLPPSIVTIRGGDLLRRIRLCWLLINSYPPCLVDQIVDCA